MRAYLVICLAALSFAASAQEKAPSGKPDPVEVRNLSATYELTNADATLRCAITLDAQAARRGLAMLFDRNVCNPRFGFLGEVTGWLPGIAGSILLVAADGRIVTEFTEGVGGVYEAIRENDGVYFFANQQFVDPADRVQPADLFGEWILSRPQGEAEDAKAKGPPLHCVVGLTDEVVGDQLFALRVGSGCDATLVAPGLQAWQLERGDIVLRFQNGDALRFEKTDDAQWNKVPERPRPLVLSRP